MLTWDLHSTYQAKEFEGLGISSWGGTSVWGLELERPGYSATTIKVQKTIFGTLTVQTPPTIRLYVYLNRGIGGGLFTDIDFPG